MKSLFLYFILSIGIITNLSATDYHIGANQTYTNINDLDWNILVAGDNVYIYYRATPYKEKIVLSGEGTAAQPISVIGVPDANGNRPVLDGDGAITTATDYFSTGVNSLNLRSLIVVSRGSDDPYVYKPKHLIIDGLELKNAHPDYTYQEDGNSQTYLDAAAGVYIHAADNVTIRNCKIHHCGNAIFTNAQADEPSLTRNMLIEGNHFYQNGVENNFLRHTTYVQSVGAIYQYNYYEDMIPNAGGNPLKDRSSGTIIRYNWITAHAQAIDLVDAQDQSNITINEPDYKQTYVYGNVIHNRANSPATRLVHYGGDTGESFYDIYRRGTLYFYHNTVINESDQANKFRVTLFRFPDLDNQAIEERVECYNNIIFNQAATAGQTPSNFYFFRTDQEVEIIAGKNWVSSTVSQHETPFGSTYQGMVQAWNDNVTIGGAANDPGFKNVALADFYLTNSAAVIDLGDPLPMNLENQFPVEKTYLHTATSTDRIEAGNAPDLGFAEVSICHNSSLTLSTQSEIDDFPINYPGCFDFQHNLTISDERMEGDEIVNLDSLESLRAIAGFFKIQSNPTLVSLTGLNNLNSVGLELNISNNRDLPNLNGLEQLQSVGTSVTLSNNQNLTSISGLQGLSTIETNLSLNANIRLPSFNGLDNIETIKGGLFITNHFIITSLTGLEGLTTINEIFIRYNDDLISLNGLQNSIAINGNLTIKDNDELMNCHSSPICNYLSSPSGTMDIQNNATGCNSETEIDNACKALGVVLQTFTAKSIKQNTLLSWQTTTETQFSHYEIEQSIDGKDFNYLGKIAAANNTHIQLYHFIHEKPVPAVHYYRLKMVEESGAFNYSNTISIALENDKTATLHFSPNPAHEVVQIAIPKQMDVSQILEVSVFNSLGQKVLMCQLTESVLDIVDLPKGIYLVQVRQAAEVASGQLIKI